MDYQGLTTDDLRNINALNRSFLALASESRDEVFSLVAERSLTSCERARLAAAPFLLYSFREDDHDYWLRLLADNPQPDLIDACKRPDAKLAELQYAGLSFLWQLARRSPYAVRLLCGAPVSWSEQLSGPTLAELLQRAAQRHDLLGLRFGNNEVVWHRLLGNGVASRQADRRAAHHFALQVMLASRREAQNGRLPAAACAIRGVTRKTPRRDVQSIREPKV